jgi:hypothetical protein
MVSRRLSRPPTQPRRRLANLTPLPFQQAALDPPSNSSADYNVLFREASGEASQAQFHAFTGTWSWADAAESVNQSATIDANSKRPAETKAAFLLHDETPARKSDATTRAPAAAGRNTSIAAGSSAFAEGGSADCTPKIFLALPGRALMMARV